MRRFFLLLLTCRGPKAAATSALLMSLLLVAGCSQFETNISTAVLSAVGLSGSDSLPDFITYLDPSPGETGPYAGKICLGLNLSALWSPGDSAETLDKLLLRSLELTVDNRPVPISSDPDYYISGPLHIVVDGAGKTIATYGGSLATCFQTKLSKGLHIAWIQVTTSSQKVKSYYWAFYVDRVDATEPSLLPFP